MHNFWFDNVAESFPELVAEIERSGTVVAPRGLATHELRNVTITIQDPTDVLLHGMNRNMNDGLAAIEALQIIGGFSNAALMARIAPNTAKFQDGGYFHGAYGPRLRGQLPNIARRLRKDRSTRQAVATIWDPAHDLYVDHLHDYPCTIYLSWLIRDGALEQTTHMRSNDLWWGWTYDVVQFTMLQNSLAQFLELPTGPYTHYADSLHVYERDMSAIHNTYPRSPAEQVTRLSGICPGNHCGDWGEVQALAYDIATEPQLYVGMRDETVSWLANAIQKRLNA